jgi:Protein of unknown function (DUF2924)
VCGETSDVWVCPEKERAAMQRRLSEVRPATLADQLLGLAKLHDSALKEHWRTLYQTAPPARISSSLLLKAIAYRLQEQALGGLKSSTRRLLERVAEDCGRRAPTRAPATTVRAGSVLIREWHGVSHRVTVLEDGALYRGKRYHSLSEVARVITGTHWSGPRFFGLRPPSKERERGIR